MRPSRKMQMISARTADKFFLEVCFVILGPIKSSGDVRRSFETRKTSLARNMLIKKIRVWKNKFLKKILFLTLNLRRSDDFRKFTAG